MSKSSKIHDFDRHNSHKHSHKIEKENSDPASNFRNNRNTFLPKLPNSNQITKENKQNIPKNLEPYLFKKKSQKNWFSSLLGFHLLEIPKTLAAILFVSTVIFGSSLWLLWQNNQSEKLANNSTSSASSIPSLTISSSISNSISNSVSISNSSSTSSTAISSSSSIAPIIIDNKGQKITDFIRTKGQIDMGFIAFENLEQVGIKPPIDVSKIEQSVWDLENKNSNNSLKIVDAKPNSTKPQTKLEEFIPKKTDLEPQDVEPKTNLVKKNLLVFPKYKIEAPIIHLTFDDMYPRDKLGNTNFAEEVNYPLDRTNCQNPAYRDTCHPVQKALEKGVVHLPMSVHPGEIGTSYIAGHTSNWQFIKSSYNSIFKPMEGQTKVGEDFFVYDNWGRKLKFRIFESLEIRADNLVEAYRKFGDRRTITLQGSVLKWTNGGLQPTHRWLSRGELVVEKIENSSPKTDLERNINIKD